MVTLETLERINVQRAKAGRPPLTRRDALRAMATYSSERGISPIETWLLYWVAEPPRENH